MPGLTGRAMTILKAKISSLLNRAENPAETLDYSYEEQLQGLDQQIAGLETQQQQLVEQQQTLSQKVESFRTQKEVIKAQYSAAEAQVRIGEAATGIGGRMKDAGAAIERARSKTEQMQARASAMDELIQSGTLEDYTSDKTALDRELAQMASQTQVESELAKMKQELGKGDGGTKELEGGEAPAAETIEPESADRPTAS